jgi:hypothetical protein
MAHVLRITDGTTTVNLAGDSDHISLESYVPKAPDVSVVEAESLALEDGGRVTNVARRNVTEPCNITITASTSDAVRAALRSVEALLRQAEEYVERGVGDPVYVELQPGGSGDVYRSQLFYGSVTPGSQALGLHYYAPGLEARITWRRQWFWEGPQVAIPLTNANGTDVTSGLRIWCHDDAGAGHDNYVAIDGADVEGVIPAPIQLILKNQYNNASRSYEHYIAQNIWSVPGSFTHIIEAEDADYKAGGLSATAYASCSGGYYQEFTWTGDTWVTLARFYLDTTFLNSARGNWFRILARFHGTPTGATYLKPKVTFTSANTTVFECPQLLLDTSHNLQDLGVVQLPPWLRGETGLYEVRLVFDAKKTGGGSLYWDFLQLSCLDGWRRLSPRGYGVEYGQSLVDDGIAGKIWVDGWAGGTKSGHYGGYGRPIHLWPGKDQRLYFLVDNSTMGMQIERIYDVWVNYRPRRLTL